MNLKIKIIQNKRLLLTAIFLFAIVVGFGFSDVKRALAGVCIYTTRDTATGDTTTGLKTTVSDSNACDTFIENSSTTALEYLREGYTETEEEARELIQATADTSGSTDPTSATGSGDICGVLDWFSSTFFNCLLLKILAFIGYLVSAAATLFEWIIDADNLKKVLSNSVLYTIWMEVRDILNISFILVLLFSAFCTVFQVEKFNYKKILLTLILMALLVNFSFPISRVIIDFSNVIMFSFLKSMGGGSGSFAKIASTGELAKIIHPGTIPDISYLFAAIVFTFILAVTFIIIAILMIIRTVALAILIIFSPIAFVGSIVPFLSSQASKWWDALFKYSFFGPIMVFMMYVSIKLMSIMASHKASFKTIAGLQTSDTSMAALVAAYSFFAIPIVILWIGLGTAQSMSIAGASAVVGRGQKFMNWVGKGFTDAGKWGVKAPFRGVWWGAKQTGIPGGMKIKYDELKKKGRFGSEAREGREARVAGGKAEADYKAKKRKEIRDKWKDAGGASDAQINAALASKNDYERQAAAMEAAEKKGFSGLAQFQTAKAAVHADPLLSKLFDDKVKEKHIRFVIEDDISSGTAPNVAYKNGLEKLSPEQMAKQVGLHENIDTNADLQNYILTEVAPDNEYHKEFFKKLTREQRAKYISAGLNP